MSDEKRAIPRPSLPPLLWVAIGLWAGIGAAEAMLWEMEGGPFVRAVAVAVVSGIVVALYRGRGWVVLALVGYVTGGAIGLLHWSSLDGRAALLRDASTGKYRATAITDPSPGTFGERSIVRLRSPADARLEVMWPHKQAPEAGQDVEFWGTLGPDARDEWARRRHQAGITATVKARVVRRTGWARSLQGLVGPWRQRGITAIARVPGPGGDLASGVILGDRRRLAGSQADSDFRTTGLTHLVAVSGGHLVVVAALVVWLLTAARIPRAWTVWSTVAVVGLYVVATGVQASAVRAWGMAAVASVAGLTGRRSDASAGLAAAAVVALAVHPSVAFDLGFRLSVAAVAGLVLFARLAGSWVEAALPRFARPLGAPVALTLTAQAATVPLTTATFGAVSLISPVANLFAGPLVSVVLVVGLTGVVVSSWWPGGGGFLLNLAGAAGALTASIAGVLARVPGASVPLGVSAIALSLAMLFVAAGLWVLWPTAHGQAARISLAVLGMLVTVTIAGPRPPSGASITVLDVGQGDAVLVRDGAHAVLVDAGPDPGALKDALRRQSVRRLERLVITHFHDDHYGGAKGLIGLIPVGEVVVSQGSSASLPDEIVRLRAPVRETHAPQRFSCGRITMSVLSPSVAPPDPSANEASLVLLVSTPGYSAVLTGDAESVVLDPLVLGGRIGDIDAFKVGHHGSADAVSERALAVMRPELSLISVGAGNRYGHPDAVTIRMLETCGSTVRRTDRLGDIVVPIDVDADSESASSFGSRPRRGCATLSSPTSYPPHPTCRGIHECKRPEARLSHLERAGVLAAAGRGPPARSRG